jgi:nicotinate-nucleotide pyrophosphorylase (carboxylating)
MKPEYVHTIVQLALAEDLGKGGDITTNNLVPRNSYSQARLVACADGVICGVNLARAVFKALNRRVIFRAVISDGRLVRRGDTIAKISGPTRVLLSIFCHFYQVLPLKHTSLLKR